MNTFSFIGWAKQVKTKLTYMAMAAIIGANGLAAAAPMFIQKAGALALPTHVVINELSTHSASDWVELYNPTTSSVDLTGYTLRDADAHSVSLTGTLATGGYLSVGMSNYLNKDGDTAILSNGISDIDSVSYGDHYTSGHGLASTPGNNSKTIARSCDAGDTWVVQDKTQAAANGSACVFDTPVDEEDESEPGDETPPVITYTALPAPNVNGWNNTDVTVEWTVTDEESGITSPACDNVTLTTETASTTETCSATSAGGTNSETTDVIKIDKTAPVITGSVSPTPNYHGWNKNSVTVTFTCEDSGSVQSGTSDDIETVTVHNGKKIVTSPAGFCVDNAGNVATAVSVKTKIDSKRPRVTITNPSNGDTVTGTVSLEGTIKEKHLKKYTWLIWNEDGVAFKYSVKHAAITPLDWDSTTVEDGLYAVTLVAKDKAGNYSHDTILIWVDNSVPQAPELVSPTNGSTTDTFAFNFTWTDVEDSRGPVTYEWEASTDGLVGEDGSFVNPVVTADSPSNELFNPLAVYGLYYWHVRAVTSVQTYSDWSSIWTVTIEQPSTTPETPTTPTDDETTPEVQPTNSSTTNGGQRGYEANFGPAGPQEVLGSSTDKPTQEDSKPQAAAKKPDASKTCAKFLGICWYWWIPIVLTVLAILYHLYRHTDTEETTTSGKK